MHSNKTLLWLRLAFWVNAAYLDTQPKPGKSYATEDIQQVDSIPAINVNLYEVFLVTQVLDAITFRGVKLAVSIWAT